VRRWLRSLTARRRLALGAVALILVSAAGTTVALAALRDSHRDHFCTLIGSSSGISVDFGLHLDRQRREAQAIEQRIMKRMLQPPRGHHRASWHAAYRAADRAVDRHLRATLPIRRVAVCSAGHCRDISLKALLGFSFENEIRLRHPGPDPVDVAVIIDRPGQPLQLASGTVRPHRYEPNGPGCGDPWWRAEVRVDGARLQTVPD
jgi:hypothetical protein